MLQLPFDSLISHIIIFFFFFLLRVSLLFVAHLTEDEHPPKLAASPVSRKLLLYFLCGLERKDGIDVNDRGIKRQTDRVRKETNEEVSEKADKQ